MNIIFLIIAILALLLYVLNLSYKKTVQKLLESQHAEDDKDGRQTEPYQFQTNQIKYEMYDVKYLSNDNLKKI